MADERGRPAVDEVLINSAVLYKWCKLLADAMEPRVPYRRDPAEMARDALMFAISRAREVFEDIHSYLSVSLDVVEEAPRG